MKYLKYFEQASAYEAYKNGSDYVLPNVSYVVDSAEVKFNPYVSQPMNIITYYANEKLPETTSAYTPGLHINEFNSAIISHEFADGVGTITFEEDITSIGKYAFSNCTGLETVVIPDSVTTIGDEAFAYCSGLASVVIPDSVTTIGSTPFAYCSGLASVVIGSGVTSIGNYAFQFCESLTEIVCHTPTAPKIGGFTFLNVKSSGVLKVPAGSDYSSWMSTSNYYLGKYNWTIEYI